MSLENVLVQVGEVAVPALAELLYKLTSKQPVTKDDVAQSISRVAIDAGLKVEDLSRYLSDDDARRTEEAVALAGEALYGPKP